MNFFTENYMNGYSKILPNQTTYPYFYKLWVDNLIARANGIYVWSGPEEDGIPQREIEIPLIIGGSCFITDKYKKKLTAFRGQYAGEPTEYYDMYKEYTVYSPIHSDTYKVDKDGIVFLNNSFGTPLYQTICKYAALLSHTETTLIDVLIELRNQSGVPIAGTSAAISSYKTWRNNLSVGNMNALSDPAFSGISFGPGTSAASNIVKDLIEAKENLLNAFLSEIGVKTSWNKKGNMIQEEVNGNDAMLVNNIMDGLKMRKDSCEKFNKKYGKNWSVDIAEELKYDEEGGKENDEASDNQ